MFIYKYLVALLLLCSAYVYAVGSFNLNFHVRLYQNGCTVIGDKDIYVDFSEVDVKQVNSTPAQEFSIDLNCNVGMPSVSLQFAGEAAGTNNQYIKNKGTAANVAVEIRSNTDDTLISNGRVLSQVVDPDTGRASFPMKAKIVPLDGTLKSGTLSAVVEFTILYP